MSSKDMTVVELRSPSDRAHEKIDAVELDRTPELKRTVSPETPNAHCLSLHEKDQ